MIGENQPHGADETAKSPSSAASLRGTVVVDATLARVLRVSRKQLVHRVQVLRLLCSLNPSSSIPQQPTTINLLPRFRYPLLFFSTTIKLYHTRFACPGTPLRAAASHIHNSSRDQSRPRNPKSILKPTRNNRRPDVALRPYQHLHLSRS